MQTPASFHKKGKWKEEPCERHKNKIYLASSQSDWHTFYRRDLRSHLSADWISARLRFQAWFILKITNKNKFYTQSLNKSTHHGWRNTTENYFIVIYQKQKLYRTRLIVKTMISSKQITTAPLIDYNLTNLNLSLHCCSSHSLHAYHKIGWSKYIRINLWTPSNWFRTSNSQQKIGIIEQQKPKSTEREKWMWKPQTPEQNS